jgi:hypothetical protein
VRFLKLILAAVLVVVSLATGLLVALATAAVFLVGRLLAGRRGRPVAAPRRAGARPYGGGHGDVIEVSATEVPGGRD